MELYQIIFIARQEISLSQVNELITKIKSIIEKHEGHTKKTEYCGLRPLAYQIKKNVKGHFIIFNIELNKKILNNMQSSLKLNEDLLRIVAIKVSNHEEEPSNLYNQSKSFRK